MVSTVTTPRLLFSARVGCLCVDCRTVDCLGRLRLPPTGGSLAEERRLLAAPGGAASAPGIWLGTQPASPLSLAAVEAGSDGTETASSGAGDSGTVTAGPGPRCHLGERRRASGQGRSAAAGAAVRAGKDMVAHAPCLPERLAGAMEKAGLWPPAQRKTDNGKRPARCRDWPFSSGRGRPPPIWRG